MFQVLLFCIHVSYANLQSDCCPLRTFLFRPVVPQLQQGLIFYIGIPLLLLIITNQYIPWQKLFYPCNSRANIHIPPAFVPAADRPAKRHDHTILVARNFYNSIMKTLATYFDTTFWQTRQKKEPARKSDPFVHRDVGLR